jgi:hypothetical protein
MIDTPESASERSFVDRYFGLTIAGRFQEAKPAVLVLAVVFAVKFALPG